MQQGSNGIGKVSGRFREVLSAIAYIGFAAITLACPLVIAIVAAWKGTH